MNLTNLLAVSSAPLLEQIELSGLIVWAMLLGGMIGLERSRAAKASGIRTHMLVSGAGAAVAAVSVGLDGAVDPSRGIHGVITGIGFLGAGCVIQSKKGWVTGLTTAAAIFYTAAIGCAVGVGYGLTATIATLTALLVLRGVGYLSYKYPISHKGEDEQEAETR